MREGGRHPPRPRLTKGEMIKDPSRLGEIRKDWVGARVFQAKVHRQLNAAATIGGIGGLVTSGLRDTAHSLVLLFAFSVLEQALQQLEKENVFSTKKTGLATLMRASKKALSWKDFGIVDRARERRNELAHHQKIMPRGECWDYIDAIERELLGWKIIPAGIPFKH